MFHLIFVILSTLMLFYFFMYLMWPRPKKSQSLAKMLKNVEFKELTTEEKKAREEFQRRNREIQMREDIKVSLNRSVGTIDRILCYAPVKLNTLRVKATNHALEVSLGKIKDAVDDISGELLERVNTLSMDVSTLLNSVPSYLSDTKLYDRRIFTPFLERMNDLDTVARELLREIKVQREKGIEEMGKSIQELPMKSLEESALFNSKRKALEAAQSHLSPSEAKSLEIAARRSRNEEEVDSISLEETRLRRYLGNIEEAQHLRESLDPGVTSINGVPVEKLVEGIVAGNTERLRSEVVIPSGQSSPEDDLMRLSLYTESLRNAK